MLQFLYNWTILLHQNTKSGVSISMTHNKYRFHDLIMNYFRSILDTFYTSKMTVTKLIFWPIYRM